jgi:RepB DNA-primase from phage plasmid
LSDPDARPNELTRTRQLFWQYPEEAERAADYLVSEAQLERDCYFGVHLFQERGNRRADNTQPTVRALWLDEDGGRYPEEGPRPTATVRSSRSRRHLYWLLTHPVAVEWAVAINRRLAACAGGDTGKAGLASVLRAPGTANYKRQPWVDLVVGEFTREPGEAAAWEPSVLDQAVPEIADPPRASLERQPYDGPDLDLAPYLENVQVLGILADSKGTKYQIVCPWVAEHTGGDRTGTRIGQRTNGALWFHCDHAHCEGRTWREFKRAVSFASEADARSRRVDLPGYSGPNLGVTIRHAR